MASDTRCVYPWYNINTTPMGQCKLCCNISDFKVIYERTDRRVTGRNKRAVGWGRDGIDSIWNGHHMRSIRRLMLDGGRPEDCGECYAMEDRGMTSPRQTANRDHLSKIPIESMTEIASELPRSLELRLSTRCNLRCHTCWSGSSDRIAEERQAVLGSDATMPEWLREDWQTDIDINLDNLSGTDSDSDPRYISSGISLDNFKLLAPKLERLYITGGEPTMDSNIYPYLEALERAGNTSCHVSWTTNATLWNEKLMSCLRPFPNNEIQVSVDGHELVAEYVRFPTKWNDVHSNVERYMTDGRVGTMRVFTVISALNAGELEPMLRWLVDTSNRTGRDLFWWPIMVSFPRHLRAHVLSERVRHGIAKRLSAIDLDTAGWTDMHCGFRGGLREVIGFLSRDGADNGPDSRSKLASYLDFMDGIRGHDHRKALANLDLGD
jgi:hypothetical protein